MLKIIDDKRLSSPCYDIIMAMHSTGVFKERKPNQNSPTLIHLQVQDYLNELYNGEFLHIDFSCVAGNWRKIQDAVVCSIPIGRPIGDVNMACYFWNPWTNKSQFLMYVSLKPFMVPEVKEGEKENLRERELPLDICRCVSILCPRYEQCARSRMETKNMYWQSAFVFVGDKCDYFIKEE